MTHPYLRRGLLPCALLSLCTVPLACSDDDGETGLQPTSFTDGLPTSDGTTTEGDGDGDPTDSGDGDGDDPATATDSGDGDGDPTSGDGDGDPTSGDGDGDPTSGDGDGDSPLCGNGVVDEGEECDVGEETMFCDGDCTFSVCGDGYHNMLSEECDDGNANNDDGCIGACLINVCGDGTVYVGVEECDDGNNVDEDDCLNACTLSICGDGVIHADNEECEDGNDVDTDACTNACLNAVCGDGILQEGVELCDDNNFDDSDECPGSCEPAFCGDGYTQQGVEECDDGNDVDDDFCSNTCESDGWFDNYESNNLLTLPYQFSGNANWITSNTNPHQGSFVAANGDIDNSQTSTMEVTLNVAANGAVVNFWHRESTEGSFDYLRFYIDDVQQGNGWSGNNNWAFASYPVNSGNHTFRWTYSKDGSVSSNEDTVYIDELYIGLPP